MGGKVDHNSRLCQVRRVPSFDRGPGRSGQPVASAQETAGGVRVQPGFVPGGVDGLSSLLQVLVARFGFIEELKSKTAAQLFRGKHALNGRSQVPSLKNQVSQLGNILSVTKDRFCHCKINLT